MASYRYERDIDPKDIAPRKKRVYTRKERWANWWDYNLKWVLCIGLVVAFVAYTFIGQYFFTTHADYNVAVVSPDYLPESTTAALENTLASYGEDLNGDGKVDNIDAALIYAHLNGKHTLTEEQLKAADVNGDGIVNNLDAMTIMDNLSK